LPSYVRYHADLSEKTNENSIDIYRNLYLSEDSNKFKFKDGRDHTFGLDSKINLSLNELQNYDFDADARELANKEITEVRQSRRNYLNKRLSRSTPRRRR